MRRVFQAIFLSAALVAAPVLLLAALGFADSSFAVLLHIVLMLPVFGLMQIGLIDHNLPEKHGLAVGFFMYVAIMATIVLIYTRKERISQAKEWSQDDSPGSR